MFKFSCPFCSTTIRAKESQRGQWSRCPRCKEPFGVPREPGAPPENNLMADAAPAEEPPLVQPNHSPTFSAGGENAFDGILSSGPAPFRPQPARPAGGAFLFAWTVSVIGALYYLYRIGKDVHGLVKATDAASELGQFGRVISEKIAELITSVVVGDVVGLLISLAIGALAYAQSSRQ